LSTKAGLVSVSAIVGGSYRSAGADAVHELADALDELGSREPGQLFSGTFVSSAAVTRIPSSHDCCGLLSVLSS
jgi:hypothetical protein